MTKNKLRINFATGYDQPTIDMLNLIFEVEVCDQFDTKSDLLIFLGGSDVDPYFYQEDAHTETYSNTDRDLMERQIFKYHNINKPKLGICRGGQFLTVMNDGKLIQDVDNHYTMHNIKTKDGKIFKITSDHHQMMYPFNLKKNNYEIIATSIDDNLSTMVLGSFHENGNNVNIKYPENFVEPEIIFYPSTNSLCIQGHPEYSFCPGDTVSYSLELIKNKLKL